MRKKVLRPSQFVIEDALGPFDGYTYGRTWNGWACPYFPKPAADQLMAVQHIPPHFLASYDEDTDSYTFVDVESDTPGEHYTVTGERHILDGTPVTLYP